MGLGILRAKSDYLLVRGYCFRQLIEVLVSKCDILPHISIFRVDGNRFLPALDCFWKIALGLPCHTQGVEGLGVMRFLRKDQLEAVAGFGPLAALLMEEGEFLGDGQGVGMFFKRGTQKPGGVVQLIGETGSLCLLEEISELR